MHDHLTAIINNKVQEIKQLKINWENQLPNDRKSLRKKSFKKALEAKGLSIIAEIKRKSPSKGKLADIIDPVGLAKQYVAGGATAISVLTDSFAFNGSLNDLSAVASSLQQTDIPILRKDFILDEAQIVEAALAGANAVLLIVAVSKEKTKTLLSYCQQIGIDALVEVHDRAELEYAVNIGADLIGINNRNLTSFNVDIENAVRLKEYLPKQVISIAESGIDSPDIAHRYAKLGYHAVLVGEALVKSTHIKKLIHDMRAV